VHRVLLHPGESLIASRVDRPINGSLLGGR
jgi:hypothetical protein